MNWSELIGKKVFIKLREGSYYREAEVLDYDDPFFTIRDNKTRKQISLNINEIARISEDRISEDKNGKQRY